MSLHFFELKKLPVEVNKDNVLLLWLNLFKAETKEEINQIKALEVPIMEQAITAYERISVSPKFRELEKARSIARSNETSALRHARQEGRQEERNIWQGVVADKDAEIARLREELGKK